MLHTSIMDLIVHRKHRTMFEGATHEEVERVRTTILLFHLSLTNIFAINVQLAE